MGADEFAGGECGLHITIRGPGTAQGDHRLGERRILGLDAEQLAHHLRRAPCGWAAEASGGEAGVEDVGVIHQSRKPA